MKCIVLTALTLLLSFASFATIGPITFDSGDTVVCVSSSVFLNDTTSGGVWSSSDTLLATINSSGVITGMSTGAVTITYAVGGSYQTKSFMVKAAPLPIIGPSYLCEGAGAATYNDPTPGGGTWKSPGLGIEWTGLSSAGVICGTSAISSELIFTDSAGCSTSKSVGGVGELMPAIRGDTIIFVDSTTTLHAPDPSATWSSSDTSIATIDAATGFVKGIAPGTVTITYILGCIGSGTLTVLPPTLVPIQSKVDDLSIFPNPTTHSLTITASSNITNIVITNLLGQTLYSQQYNSAQIEVNVSYLSKGMYLIRINDSEVRKFLKE